MTDRTNTVSASTDQEIFNPEETDSLLWGIPGALVENRQLLETLVRAPKLLKRPSQCERLVTLGEAWLRNPGGFLNGSPYFYTFSAIAKGIYGPEMNLGDFANSDSDLTVTLATPERAVTEAIPVALEAIAWAKIVHLILDVYPDVHDFCERMLDTLLGISEDATSLSATEHGLLRLLLAGELPLTCAVLFTDRVERTELWEMAKHHLNEAVAEIFDGEGVPISEMFDAHRLLLASLLRCRRMVQWMGQKPGFRRKSTNFWTENADINYEWLIRHALRWSRLDGGQIFVGETLNTNRRFWDLLLADGGDDDDHDIAKLYLPCYRSRGDVASNVAFPPAQFHSEWAGVSTLRPNWFAEYPRLTILSGSEPYFDIASVAPSEQSVSRAKLGDVEQPTSQQLRQKLGIESLSEDDDGDENDAFFEDLCSRDWTRETATRLELESQVVLFSGFHSCELTCGDESEPRPAISDWKENIHVSDENGDYLELSRSFDGARVERHYFLGREDRFMFTADVIFTDEPEQMWNYRTVLSMPQEVDWYPQTETFDGYLIASRRGSAPRPRALLMPLAFPEWKQELDDTSEPFCAIHRIASGLELTRRMRGSAFCVPLWAHLDPRDMSELHTWRRLTVAENRTKVSEEVAVGYRVQVDNRQWLIYRATGQRGNRSLLGHNLTSEFLLARFSAEHGVQPLVEIE